MSEMGDDMKPANSSSIRIGIDVGGTFTHAVAIDTRTMQLVDSAKVPTTHRAAEGVAKGIIESLRVLLDKSGVSPEQVGFIAHSTTQATNALLEGDVAPVGILCLGQGLNGAISRQVSDLKRIELSPGKYLKTEHRYVDIAGGVDENKLKSAINALVEAGSGAIAVTQAFSVDDPEAEQTAVELARSMGIFATAGHEVSQLYGFKVRTRTAVINASMLPKMIESADMTESSVRDAGIAAPVMIMRSDGGVMDIDSMRRRPILTMLSGPAAGVAAAMMFLHISDGIFLEVGGTSTDISAIANGRAKIRTAEVGGHRIYMKTLDVRTEGVAGGSLPRLDKAGHDLIAVGPRSAHIADLAYASFESELENPSLLLDIDRVSPIKGDPDDYLAFKIRSGGDNTAEARGYAITPTCASNLLGYVPDGDCALGNSKSIDKAFSTLAAATGKDKKALAERILDLSADKCIPVVEALIKDHKLDREMVTLVGGGGGAAAIVPHVAKRMGMKHSLARDADVISAIGVAMALIRECIERQFVNPTNDDILKVRQEAHAAVEAMGADPSTIEVQVEVDARTNVVRATAFGSTAMEDDADAGEAKQKQLDDQAKLTLAADSMRVPAASVDTVFDGKYFRVYRSLREDKQLLGLITRRLNSLRVMDRAGSIRLQFKNAVAEAGPASETISNLERLLEENADWGDAGKVIPDTMLLAGNRILDFSGLPDVTAVLSLVRAELELVPAQTEVVILLCLS